MRRLSTSAFLLFKLVTVSMLRHFDYIIPSIAGRATGKSSGVNLGRLDDRRTSRDVCGKPSESCRDEWARTQLGLIGQERGWAGEVLWPRNKASYDAYHDGTYLKMHNVVNVSTCPQFPNFDDSIPKVRRGLPTSWQLRHDWAIKSACHRCLEFP